MMQKWKIYVDGEYKFPIQTDAGKGAQYVLNKAKRLWKNRRIEVVAVI